MIQNQGIWVPYELKPWEVKRHFFACKQLLQRQNRKGFSHRIVTSDEKWVYYDNSKRRKSWGMPGNTSRSTAIPNIHGAKVMRCIWWGALGLVYYEMLKSSETSTGDWYRTQYDLRIEGVLATVPRETRENDLPAWLCSARCRKTGQDIFETVEMEAITPYTVLSRRCFFQL